MWPQNILLTSESRLGDIKIVDFGLSRIMSSNEELREIMGTPEYVETEPQLRTACSISGYSKNKQRLQKQQVPAKAALRKQVQSLPLRSQRHRLRCEIGAHPLPGEVEKLMQKVAISRIK
ncbi:UNVERIFIED_CONTAM: hypothetical protein FKN15_025582 [Acipenser sinensis]